MKYKFTDEVVNFQGHELHRIQALKDTAYGDVKAGELGGLIEKETNLSQNDNCWVTYGAVIMDNATVTDNAIITGNAIVKDTALVTGNSYITANSIISGCSAVMGNAVIKDKAVIDRGAIIKGDAVISGNAYITEGADISGNAYIGDNAIIKGVASISDHAVIGHNAVIQNTEDYLYVNGARLGNNFDGLTAYIQQGKVTINLNATNSYSLDELTQKISQTDDPYKYNNWSAYLKYAQSYFYK